jgi:hypothetical protein
MLQSTTVQYSVYQSLSHCKAADNFSPWVAFFFFLFGQRALCSVVQCICWFVFLPVLIGFLYSFPLLCLSCSCFRIDFSWIPDLAIR